MKPGHESASIQRGSTQSDVGAPPLGDAARDAVARRLAREAKRFPDLDIAPLETAELTPLDAAFAHAVYDAVIRRWLTLEFLLNAKLKQPLHENEPRLQAALLMGAAQIVLMDRVPRHSAINHAVEWAKLRIRPGAGALVNAVLRRISELVVESPPGSRGVWTDDLGELPIFEGGLGSPARSIALTGKILPSNSVERLAVTTSHATPLLRRWEQRYGGEETKRLALHSLLSPPTVLNTRSRSPDGPLVLAHDSAGSHLFRGTQEELRSFLDAEPSIWVQDAASAIAVESVRSLRARTIVDFCAGRGTKTRQLAAVFPSADIVATDTDDKRRATLAEVFRSHPRVRVMTPAAARETMVARADLIVLDVPCSNSGVLARRVEAKYRFGDRHLSAVTQVQRQIIADVIPMLTQGAGRGGRGGILYATCSLEPEENEDQAAWAKRWHGYEPEFMRQSRPRCTGATDYTDGSFSVLLV